MLNLHTPLRAKAMIASALAVVLVSLPAIGQEPKASDEVKIPKPEVVKLDGALGLTMKATYYAGLRGKKTVPIVLLHDFKGNRTELDPLALKLQAEGFAVIVPDLRGHGDSTKIAGQGGKETTIEAAKMGRNDFDMIWRDLQGVRNFLIQKNNAGDLNLNATCVVGTGMSSVIAIKWTALDWSVPSLVSRKQGQDIHALVLISPVWSFQGVTIQDAINQPDLRSKVSTLILVGKGKEVADAKRLHKAFEKFRPNESEEAQNKTLFYREAPVNLQGTALLTNANLSLDKVIAKFLEWRVTSQDFPWEERNVNP